MPIVAVIAIAIVALIVVGLLLVAIDGFRNSRLKTLLDYCDPNTETQISVDAAIYANIGYVTKQAKRIMPLDGNIEISATAFVIQHKNRDPFLVHDMLHSSVKYLSTIAKKTNFSLVYDKSFVIRRKTASGMVETIDQHKDQMLALCIHWFIWNYSSNPYALDQSFKKIAASTNLLFGRMYGYHDHKSYDCNIECWERYTPTWEYKDGVTKGMEVAVERSKKQHVYVNIMKYPSAQDVEAKSRVMFKEIDGFLLRIEGRTENVFYQIFPKLLRKACFSNDRQKIRNEIAPFGVGDDWGNNFDAWFFVCSVFLACRMLRNDVGDERLDKDKEQFLSVCYPLRVKISDLNLDRCSFEALGGTQEFYSQTSISYGNLFTKLESYMESKFHEIFLDFANRSAAHEKIDIAAIFAFWNYLLFGSYDYISIWNRTMANTAINMSMNTMNDYSSKDEHEEEAECMRIDPTLN